MSNIKYSPKLPLQIGQDNLFESNLDVLDNIKQNLKMIILTNPGEKIMDPEFGIGIRRYLFEHASGMIKVDKDSASGKKTFSVESFQTKLLNEINKQTNIYLQNTKVTNVSINIDELIMNIVIEYNYKNIIDDVIEVQLET